MTTSWAEDYGVRGVSRARHVYEYKPGRTIGRKKTVVRVRRGEDESTLRAANIVFDFLYRRR